MTVNVQMSPALRELVVKNGQIDFAELQKIAQSSDKDNKLVQEANKLLREGLSGNKAFGDIGDGTGYLKEPTNEELMAQEPKRGFFGRVGKYVNDWWTDKDKVSKDGKDDGHISAGEKAESFAKGFLGGMVKSIAEHPVASLLTIGGMAAGGYLATAGLTALGVTAAAPIVGGVLALVGIGYGVTAIVRGAKGAKNATTDAQAKASWEGIGMGTMVTGLSAFAAVKSAKNIIQDYRALEAGVTANQPLQMEMIKALDKAKYDKGTVIRMMKEHPDFIDKISQYKAPDGKPLFSPSEINDILYNLKSTIEQNPQKLYAILDNPEEVANIVKYNNRGAGLWRAAGDPFESTVKANPELFGRTASSSATQTAGAAVQTASEAAPKGVSSEFLAKFKAAQSTQDLEALVQQASNKEECLYIAEQLGNRPMANQRAIDDIVLSARNKAVSYIDAKSAAAQTDVYYDEHGLIQNFYDGTSESTVTSAGKTRTFMVDVAKAKTPESLRALLADAQSEQECADIMLRIQYQLRDNLNADLQGLQSVYKAAAQRAKAFRGISVRDIRNYMVDRHNFENEAAVRQIIAEHPNYIERLASYTKADGTHVFDEYNIVYNLLDHQADVFLKNPERVFAVLENPEEMSGLWSSHGLFQTGKLECAIKHPLESTRSAHPGLFAPEAEVNVQSVSQALQNMSTDNPGLKAGGIKALEQHPELVEQLAGIRTSDGHVLLDSEDIAGFFCNIANDMKNPTYMQNLIEIINDPVKMGYVEVYRAPAFGLWKVSHGW